MSTRGLHTVITVVLSCCYCVTALSSNPVHDNTRQPSPTHMERLYHLQSSEIARDQPTINEVYHLQPRDTHTNGQHQLLSTHEQPLMNQMYQLQTGELLHDQMVHSNHEQTPSNHAYQLQSDPISRHVEYHTVPDQTSRNRKYQQQIPGGLEYHQQSSNARQSDQMPLNWEYHTETIQSARSIPTPSGKTPRSKQPQTHSAHDHTSMRQKQQKQNTQSPQSVAFKPDPTQAAISHVFKDQIQGSHKFQQQTSKTSITRKNEQSGAKADTQVKQPQQDNRSTFHKHKTQSDQIAIPQEHHTKPGHQHVNTKASNVPLNPKYQPLSEQEAALQEGQHSGHMPGSHEQAPLSERHTHMQEQMNQPHADHIAMALDSLLQSVYRPVGQEVQPQGGEAHMHMHNLGSNIMNEHPKHAGDTQHSGDNTLLKMMQHMEIVHAYLQTLYTQTVAKHQQPEQHQQHQAQPIRHSGGWNPAVDHMQGVQQHMMFNTMPVGARQGHTAVHTEFAAPSSNQGHSGSNRLYNIRTGQPINTNQGATNPGEYETPEVGGLQTSHLNFANGHVNSFRGMNTASGRKQTGSRHGEFEAPEAREVMSRRGHTSRNGRPRTSGYPRSHQIPGATIMFL